MDISKHLDKAAEALRKKNFDYAISLYQQVLMLKPDHGEARRELRQALVRRAEYKKVSPGLAMIQGAHHRMGIGVGKLMKKPDQVVRAAESYLRNDPRNPAVNRALAEALETAGHGRSAIAVWEFLGDDENLGDYALKRAGALYYSLADMEKALGCYETVLKRNPRDSEAEKMRKNLAAEGVLSSGSYDPTKSSRDLARDKDKVRERQVEQKIVTTDDERALLSERLRSAVTADPKDSKARRQLVDFYVKNRELDAAIETLEEGVQLDSESYELKERLGDVRMLRFETEIRKARAAANKGDDAAATDLVDLEREKLDFEVEEFSRRVAEHPTDLGLRFRLGQILLAAGEVDRAIENFQHAVKDPRRRVDSLMGLGEAFERNDMLDLARKQFAQALDSLDAGTDRATEVTYALGCLDQKLGDTAGAKARFESIYERDIHYRDVADRIASLANAGATTTASADTTPKAPAVDSPPPPAKEPASPSPETPNEGADESGGSVYDFKE